ncbi:MAG TPA: response regulator [Nitrososphaeraceae archaeon]|nr:response regulator [Nitrososphaeraceae archaeon]
MQDNKNTIKKYPYRILLVDDEADISLTFSIVLEDNGFVVNAFNDPLLALSSFKQGLYALALIDIKMPKMNGFDLYRQIRKLDDKVKVCFMTAFDIKKEEIKAALATLNEE